MPEEKLDLRVRKTRRAITEAILELMYEEGFEAVTIKQILDRAEVNRSTFYAHYRDKYDLRDKIEQQLLDEFADAAEAGMSAAFEQGTPDASAFPAHIDAMLRHLQANARPWAHLLGPDGDMAFQAKLAEAARRVWADTGLLARLSLPETYVFAGMSGLLSSVLAEWARSGFDEREREGVARTLAALMPDPEALVG
ncbi:MAG: TetR/AcrR family transcriptional regulator [Atopobiaceae bacterium]|nr:TetR/AcrR family transcriptional regulator [Atopobiaceae bacterium]